MSELLTPEILRNRISGKNEDRIQNVFLSVIIFLLCIYIFLNNFVFATVYVSGDSMLPNFVDGQYLVGNRFEAFVGDFEYGDVVVVNVEFKDDGTIDNNGKKIIKRIVGLPGDVIDFKNGKLVRNGEVVIEDYIPSDVYSNENGGEGFPYTVKEGNVFVLGDNRAISKDSRTAYREISNKQIYAVIATWSID